LVELLPLVKIVHRHDAPAALESLAKHRLGVDGLGHRVDGREADFDVLGPIRNQSPPHKSSVRDPAFWSYRTMGRLSVGATFQLGAKFGVGYSGGIRNAILISDTSVSSLARPHMLRLYH
jgi:hypothetical protein